jgi:hypothetical protein
MAVCKSQEIMVPQHLVASCMGKEKYNTRVSRQTTKKNKRTTPFVVLHGAHSGNWESKMNVARNKWVTEFALPHCTVKHYKWFVDFEYNVDTGNAWAATGDGVCGLQYWQYIFLHRIGFLDMATTGDVLRLQTPSLYMCFLLDIKRGGRGGMWSTQLRKFCHHPLMHCHHPLMHCSHILVGITHKCYAMRAYVEFVVQLNRLHAVM